jgi:hypothetical protein
MALVVIRTPNTQHRIHDLLMQLHNDVEQQRLLDEARQCVFQLESKYKLSSDRIHEAIDAGDLVETLEVSHWILLYNLLQRVNQT